MNEILVGILKLLAGCGTFMVGMKLLSDGLEGSAGKSMRKLFNKISNNRFAGVGIGAGVTAIIQSSSATTVMVIGFVNAGVMTLFQATAIIMGANIGTTITAFIAAFSSFDFGTFAAALAFVGILMSMLFKKNSVKQIGGMLSGLGLIFVGLDLMSGALSTPVINEAFNRMFTSLKDLQVVLIIVGMVFTAIIQSSSAATTVVIALSAGGVLPIESALFIILGTNIGTCITALIASLGASTNAKRAALIHLTFNLIGTLIFSVILAFTSKYMVNLLKILSPGYPAFQIAIFHLIFNVITTGLLLPLIKQLVWLATKLIKEKVSDEEVLKLYYIDDRILHTPPIAVAQVLKEVLNMAEIARKNLDRAYNALVKGEIKDAAKIRREEEKLDFINKGIAKYLVKMAGLNLPYADDKLIGSLHHVISDLERIGDHAENFLEEAEEMTTSDATFSDSALVELDEMYGKISDMFRRAVKVFEYRDVSGLDAINSLENEVDKMKKQYEINHVLRLNRGECTVESGAYFYVVITALERIADHLTNIAFSIKKQNGVDLSKAPQKSRHADL